MREAQIPTPSKPSKTVSIESLRNTPPFRADHVGSYLRPESLLEKREQHKNGEISAAALRTHENECIRELVKFEEGLGLQAVTDGEFRRGLFHADFINKIDGITFGPRFRPDHTKTGQRVPSMAVVSGRIARPETGIEVDNFKYLKSLTDRVAKQTIPSPTMTHFRGGRDAIDRAAYPDLEGFFADLARVYREEVQCLAQAGCRYLQLDDTNLAYLCDPKMRSQLEDRGEDLEQLLHAYARLINDSIRSRPDDMTVCIHTCRGNFKSQWFAEGGYEIVADIIFNEIDVDGFFLEYDDQRSGGFEPLRRVPPDKTIVLGLVSSKWAGLEDKSALVARIEEASKYVPLDQLCLSTQCGFASVADGNQIDVEVERAKIGLITDVVDQVWG